MQPQPIDLNRFRDHEYRVACNVFRARRYSSDPAKARYYAAERNRRYARLLTK